MIYRITEYDSDSDTWKQLSKTSGNKYRGTQKPRIYTQKRFATNALNIIEGMMLESNESPIYRIEQSETDWKPI